MYKRIALVLAVVMIFVMVSVVIYAQDQSAQKDKAATCTMHEDGKCTQKDANCSKENPACKDKTSAQCCPKQQEARKSACKESSCKSSCPAQSACKAADTVK